MKFEVKITGLDTIQKALINRPKEIFEEVALEFEATANEITTEQKRRAPKDVGGLVQSISNHRSAPLTHELTAQKQNAIWQEFGTKNKARIPAGLEDIAAQFRGVGTKSGLGAKEAIYNWCKRKGIERKFWFPIYRSIVTNGIRPHPFFFDPYFQARPKLIERIKNILVA